MFEKLGYILVATALIVVFFQIGFTEEEVEQSTYINKSLELEEALDLATQRILDDWHEDGTFNYIYYPDTGTYSDDYNIIRHILGAYTLIELGYPEEAGESIEWTLQYLVTEEDYSYLTYDGQTKLGAAATMVLTLLAYDDPQYDETIEDLANFMLYMQNADGGYRNYHPIEDPDNRLATVLYTGESNLAFIELYKKTGDSRYLDALESSYNWVESYFAERHSTGLVSWTSIAFAETYYETGDEKYRDLAFEMTDWLIDNTQYTAETAPTEEYIGAFLINDIEGGLTCTVGAYGEGIVEMIELAQYSGDIKHKIKYEKSLESALEFLLSMQLEDGGFQASMFSSHYRIDFNTHAALTLLGSMY